MISGLLLATERRAIIGLAGLYSSRMLGLFMVLPVLALSAESLQGATPMLVGLALGVYGLMQALLQIPFGLLSDRLGRKRVIAVGLILFLIGSIIAALADSIVGIIVGRSLQGSGAVAAAIMALLADQTREEVRTAAMAMIGLSIGVAFAVAMVTGPLLSAYFGLSGIFWLTAVLALLGLLVLWKVVPKAPKRVLHRDVGLDRQQLKSMLLRLDLLRLDISIFSLHLILMAIFVVIPFRLVEVGFESAYHGWVYLTVMGLAFIGMVPLVMLAEKKRQMKPVFILSVALLTLCLAAMGVSGVTSWWWLACLLLGFFIAFNLLEATLPSMISKMAPAGAKGTAMGVYSTSQFLGAFLGGLLGGVLDQYWGHDAVFYGAAVVGVVWLGSVMTMPAPRHLASEVVALDDETRGDALDTLMTRLAEVAGVEDVLVVPEERVAYLKVDRQQLDSEALARIAGTQRGQGRA
ncbi:MFS transporter [Aidingimonas halophila]|uniref:Predicted arabinose efflux permease, MFS family n=1 Tax=Aidingimonas halophila TaxID=574349 RepID=A0A1H3HKM6_9GAMM|nr:MFS transporter [Aidingimonas halophila]GHC37214.1 MFS transporter [Aidingimonas halophila]SDY16047.1 Predicted arabinose efflux permease, MFS family [Aidingimonas halophila]